MNKLTLPIAILALLASAATFFYSQPNEQLVYVDINKLVEGYARTKVERAAFEKKAGTLKANVDSLVVNWQDELKTYEKERSSMSKKELELKQELLQNKQQQINNYQQAIQKQIQEEDQKMTQTVINDINDYVRDYGKKKGYRIIFGAGGSGNIMYAEDTSDLTQTVLDGLNAQYQGK
ncbi:OmpH family outer membrane protein [Muricauda sp. SCSIO 64092]|uniref:OmpH family outer membrane protein n=1 Tax=Allomuricauda sp. SCSIO 64092 TaxID=2908842 RepID=UPI001FF6D3CC|nr:OmpH family outer membrane protein [Muricauda sp. SCSIO 64092]UOY08632.1 OmpH family outer membrane protein [Muricauda sp. SCSIO 64092]